MKKNTLSFIISIILLGIFVVQCSTESSSESSISPQNNFVDKEANEFGVSPSDISQALAFNKEDKAAITRSAKNSLKALVLQGEIDSLKASHLVNYQKELETYVNNFNRLDDLQLYSLQQEQNLIYIWIDQKIHKLSKTLGFTEKSPKNLRQQNQQLEQTLQEYIQKSDTACKFLFNETICNRVLALIQLFALEQLALNTQIQEDSAQKKLKNYLELSSKNIFDNQYPKAVTTRLYKLKKQILASPTPSKQNELLENYLRLKQILQARKIGISDQELTPLIEAFEQKK